jgi:hypothetical protein
MEAPLISIQEEQPVAVPVQPAARRVLTPARLALAALGLCAFFALAALGLPAGTGKAADQTDDETHAPNALAPVTYRTASEVAAFVPGAVVAGINPLVL